MGDFSRNKCLTRTLKAIKLMMKDTLLSAGHSYTTNEASFSPDSKTSLDQLIDLNTVHREKVFMTEEEDMG